MHILARPERAALPASVGDGVEAVISLQKETDKAVETADPVSTVLAALSLSAS